MTKRIFFLFFALAAFSFAGPLLQNEPAPLALDADTNTIDLSSVPMDDIDVVSQAASLPSESRTAALSRAISAAAIATPEPATYTFAAVALLTAGLMRRRR